MKTTHVAVLLLLLVAAVSGRHLQSHPPDYPPRADDAPAAYECGNDICDKTDKCCTGFDGNLFCWSGKSCPVSNGAPATDAVEGKPIIYVPVTTAAAPDVHV